MKRVLSLFTALLLCIALALPALAYPAGMDESLPRVVDGAGLLTREEAESLEAYARELIGQYSMDLVIVTRRGLGGKAPDDYANDFFDYEGYGWREEETEDITTGSGMLLLVDMLERDIMGASKGVGEAVFNGEVQERILTAVKPSLGNADYYAAFKRFLDEAGDYLEDYANSAGVYAEPNTGYNSGNNGGNGSYNNGSSGYSGGGYAGFNGTIFLVAALIGLIIAWAVTASMKKKHNTIRTAAAAQSYQQNFNLTERQDIFLYSNTTRMRLPDDPPAHTGGGGSGFSGGGSHTSSSGSSHTNVGGKF
ncbi:MAG: TPM domain-containing protein [Firmicutes bacterium]|nr:TPM domain-containing protein [Bacillota bacterium]